MFCNSCGNQLPDNANVCPACGTPVAGAQNQAGYQQQYQQQYQQPQQPQQQYQQPYQQQYQQPYQQPMYQQPQAPATPMKWYKFLVYFALWAGAILNLVTAIQCLTGSIYGEYKDLIYAYYPSLKTVNIIYGILLIAVSALGWYTLYAMAKYKKNAPMLLMILYGVSALVGILYIILNKAIVKDLDVNIASSIVSIAVSVAMIIANKIYFDKRKHLFVN